MSSILTNEFVWGIVLGVVLTAAGTWLQLILSTRAQREERRKIIADFCIDAITSLQNLINQLDEQRDRSRTIYHDYLALIDVETAVYGRNREHLIYLPQTVRDDVRAFFNGCAVKKAEIATHLGEFYRLTDEANQTRAVGGNATVASTKANEELMKAHAAADRLVVIGRKAPQLVSAIKAAGAN